MYLASLNIVNNNNNNNDIGIQFLTTDYFFLFLSLMSLSQATSIKNLDFPTYMK